MKDLSGQVAVITGGASGIGFGIAEKCVAEGMRVVLADIEADALERARERLAGRGEVIAVPTDVSLSDSVDALRDHSEALGPVFLVCNNAGVGGASGNAAWKVPISEWRWVLEVNLWGVINGIRSFLPAMVERDTGHIVNTASVAGLLPFPFATPYSTSKHAIVGMSLSVHHELAMIGSHVRVSVMCPGMIRTNVAESPRNWLERLGPPPERAGNEEATAVDAMIRALIEAGMEPAEVGAQVIDAVQAERFWIMPNAEPYVESIKELTKSAVEGRNPPVVAPA